MLFFFNCATFSYNDLWWNHFSTGWEKEKETRTKRRMEGREKSGGTILWCIIGIRYILVVVMKEILMDTRRWRWWWGFYLPSRNIDVHECTCNRRCRGRNRWNPPWITNTIWKIKSHHRNVDICSAILSLCSLRTSIILSDFSEFSCAPLFLRLLSRK